MTLVQEKPLDRDFKAFHEFTVRAQDLGGRTSSVAVIVYLTDENDNKPEIVYPREGDNQRFVPCSPNFLEENFISHSEGPTD